MKIELSNNDLELLFGRYEGSLMAGDRIYFSGRTMLYNIYKQLPTDFEFESKFPLLNEVLLMR